MQIIQAAPDSYGILVCPAVMDPVSKKEPWISLLGSAGKKSGENEKNQ